MRTYWWVVGVLAFAIAAPAMAQDYQKWEVEGGYSYVHFNVHASTNGTSATKAVNLNGGGGSVAYNANTWLGLVADFRGYHNGGITDSRAPGATADLTVFSYLFGPRLAYRTSSNWTPFAQVLFGGAHGSASATFNGMKSPTFTQNVFALTAGGGLDYKLTDHFSVRVGQLEYFLTEFDGGSAAKNAGISVSHQNNLRFSAGIVLRFGGK